MNVGILTVDRAIVDAQSLKDKRRVVKGLKQRLRNRFNVSVAEVDHHDLAKRCRLAIAMVSHESRPLHSQLDQAVDLVRGVAGLSLVDYHYEWL